MATLQLFMTLEELDNLMQDFMAQHDLLGILQTQTGYRLAEKLSEALVRHDDTSNIFLFPRNKPLPNPLSEQTFQPRRIGAIQLRLGGLKGSKDTEILLLTSISAEDEHDLSFKPAAWLRQLKKRVQTEGTFIFGAVGKNTVFGGEDTYKDIGYSSLALRLHQQGILWKQYADDNSVFSPLSNNPV